MKTKEFFTKKEIEDIVSNSLDHFITKYDGFDIDEDDFKSIFKDYLSDYIKDNDVIYAISDYITNELYDDDYPGIDEHDYNALYEIANDIMMDKN